MHLWGEECSPRNQLLAFVTVTQRVTHFLYSVLITVTLTQQPLHFLLITWSNMLQKKPREERMRNQYKRLHFKGKKKAKSNLLKHKMKGTDYERRTQTLGSRNQRCHSTKPPNGHSVLKRNCSWLTSLSIKKLKQFLLSSLDSIMKLSSLCAKTCL